MPKYAVIDLSHALRPGMPQTNALPRLALWWCLRQDWGDTADCQAMLVAEHSGTNVDAPRHVIPGGTTIDALPVDSFMGPALVLDLRHLPPMAEITPEEIKTAEAKSAVPIAHGDIVLLMTGHDDRYWQDTPQVYAELKKRPALTLAGAEYLVSQGVKAVGVDTTSPDVSGTPLLVHHYLLERGVLLIEGLTHLEQVPPGRFFFIALPLKIYQGTGSPVRAVAVTGLLD